MMLKSKLLSSKGVTMLELLIAFTIAGIVTSLGFTLYTAITKSLRHQSGTAEALCSTILSKKQIEQACNRISVLSKWSEREITGIDKMTDSTITLCYTGNAFYCRNSKIAIGFDTFVFSLLENRKDPSDRNAVLLWEGCMSKNGNWIGGAVVVRKE
jgi:hypothetical protein